MSFKKKIKDMYEASKLCLKYPFLYPRNRFNDRHYNNAKLISYINEKEKYTHQRISISFVYEKDKKDNASYHTEVTDCTLTFNDGNEYNILQSGRFISIYTPVELVEYAVVNIDDYIKGGIITGINVYQYKHSFGNNFNSYSIVVRMHDDYKFEFKEGMMFQPIDVKLGTLWDSFTIWGANMLNNILRVFHFIPTYTELDAMPDGWRKKFGLQMCEEIKQALLSEKDGKKLLKDYRIMQIKEKFGGLRWYDNVSTKKVSEIINKYEYISMKTCIVCGEPATYISNGWISPYCDKHIDNKDYATSIDKFYNIDADDDSTVLD